MNEKLTIVLVEDDAALSELISRKLGREGHRRVCFYKAADALAWLNDHHADLMILDLGLPDMNGERFVELLQDAKLNIPFIVATGQGSEAIAVNMIKKGARDYLVKNSELLNVLPATVEMVWKEIELERMLENARSQIRLQNATLSAVHNLSPDGVLVADHQGAILSYNPKLPALCGVAETDLSGKCSEFFRAFAAKTSHRDEVIQAFVDKENLDGEITLCRLRRDDRFLEIHSLPMIVRADAENQILGRVWYFRDVTTYIEAEEAMARAKHEAETHAQMKDHFLSMVSHDVKTPLNSIIGFSELLALTNLKENQKDFLKNIEESSSYLLTLVNDILDLSRIEHGAIELDIADMALIDTLNKSVDIFKRQAESKGLALIKDFASDLPLKIVSDELRLRQIVTNLMGNALKFTFKGNVTLRCRRAAREGFLEIAVIDTGVGIKEEYQKLIFAPFTQESASVAKRFGGTGLGLSIVKHIAAAHGGDVTVWSRLGQGSTFTLRLPSGREGDPR